MNENYLWDRSGEPDGEIVDLETKLAVYRARPGKGPITTKRSVLLGASLGGFAAAAMIALLVLIPRSSHWTLQQDEGSGARLRVGQKIETGAHAVTLFDREVGRIDLCPDSKLRVARTLSLQEGTIHAFIWAPPAKFAVETPSAMAIDLGCEYTLSVDDHGSGLVHVELGWVAFQRGAVESFIPAGAACETKPRTGPGLPYFEDATPEFRSAARAGETEAILREARPRDALTLWHLLQRVPTGERRPVALRFAQLVPGVNVEPLVRGDAKAIDGAWNQLGLGNTDWWRVWKRNW